ncbi:hypothetical protein [Bordetella pseudohinzii]|uniref:Uncharacterized protein n=1 Tax=Bordetella pseudohinzii TaxID=1331258 RepID=A0A0J6EUF6_9BORD|nr:hypothetical protein [Bordetella pseudohinzii]ANY18520.1 hypothetical protein BBN53_21085 [Bordetella pseudohinzii]KMM24080.1 hypothetical protein L540_08095 [Bordetella pseudohinzii]KXA77856.1 hypothetical protein AW878_14260 [Bordetella pseudohinzii]KXA78052.1 hypothetical protein AW877_12720 [Bordetella pseudohinzii]CUJ13613.1 Uncharacterised protein [Bordetella pseudohinzii]
MTTSAPRAGQPEISQIKSTPAYLLHTNDGRQIPFLIALLLFDQQRRPTLTPAVVCAINRTIDLTGREGLVTRTVLVGESIEQVIQTTVLQALAIPGAILLYRCQSAVVAENLMGHLLSAHHITLLKDSKEAL